MNAVILSAFAATALALPAPGSLHGLVRRQAAISEACSLGYCLENGGTTGGANATSVTVSDIESLREAASKAGPGVIVVSGSITGSGTDRVDISSDKTVFGEAGSVIDGVSLRLQGVSNVILRNLKVQNVLYEIGDAISLNNAQNVWIDHLDLSGDLDTPKENWDGLLDITHGSDWITVSNTHFHDHYKASLIGHADSNGAEDEGKLHVTFANNYWNQIDSRVPSVRFGTIHSINNYYNQLGYTGINARQKSQILLQSSVFANGTDTVIFSDGSDYLGYVVLDDVDLGGSTNSAEEGTLTPDTLPYPPIEALGSSAVASIIPETAGQLL